MPELPEVETVARTLAPQVCGRRIVGIEVLNAGTWQGGTAADEIASLRPCIRGVGRRGKLLLVHFGEGQGTGAETGEIDIPQDASLWPLFYSAKGVEQGRLPLVGQEGREVTALAFHLRMTGRLFVYPQGTKPGPHTRVIFDLDDGRRLFFDDTRKFGQVRALCGRELDEWGFWRGLGPEPLEMESQDFASRIASSRKAVKALLLDQTVVAGVGNIYADESLFRAGIRPDAKGSDIAPEKLAGLHAALVGVLLLSIRECGSSIRDYRTARGDVGAFQNSFFVYGRAGEACRACGTGLEASRVAGRATVFCPNCQK